MTLSEIIETLQLIKYEQGEDLETDIESLFWNGAHLIVRREGEHQ